MAELIKQTQSKDEGETHVYHSDDSGLDSDGYDPNDPHSAMAKSIDRRNKVV